MNVSHDHDLRTEETVVRVLRAARAADAAALPVRHTARTDRCVPVSRLLLAAKRGTPLSAADQQHLDGCEFCQGVRRAFAGLAKPVADDETTVFGSSEETTRFDSPPQPPKGG